MSTPTLKVHARDPYFNERARCGAHHRGPVQLANNNDEVTCRTCRGWLPVPERPLPSERIEAADKKARAKAATR